VDHGMEITHCLTISRLTSVLLSRSAHFRCACLVDMGEGLLARIYHTKSKLASNKRDLYLGGKSFKALRSILVDKFPKIPSLILFETNTIPGGQRFVSSSVSTCRILSSFRDLMYDLVDFAHAAAKLLLEIPSQVSVCV